MKILTLYYSDQPAELIEFERPGAVFEKVDGTGLMRAKNTESWLFQNSADRPLPRRTRWTN